MENESKNPNKHESQIDPLNTHEQGLLSVLSNLYINPEQRSDPIRTIPSRHLPNCAQPDIKNVDYDLKSFSENSPNPDVDPCSTETNRKETSLLKQKTTFGAITEFLFKGATHVVEINIRKTKTIEFIHYQFLFNSLLQLIFSLASILAAIIEYEHTVISIPDNKTVYIHTHIEETETLVSLYGFDFDYINNCKEACLLATWSCFIASIFLWITVIFDYVLSHLKTNFVETAEAAEVFQSPYTIATFILTFIFLIPCPNPMTYGIEMKFLSVKYGIEYHVPLNSFFTTFCLFRIWFILKYYLVSSRTYDSSSFRVLDMNSVKSGIGFPFKAHMIRDPLKLDIFLFFFCLFFCSYNMRIFERYLDHQGDSYFGNLINDIWCIFITMTTVGYGDLSPSTEFGCLFAIIACFFGVFLVSLVVVSVTSYLNIMGSELKAYHVLTRTYLMERKEREAVLLVKNYLLSLKHMKGKKPQNKDKKGLNLQKKVVTEYANFKNVKEKLDGTFPPLNEFDMIKNHLNFLEEGIVRTNKRVDTVLTMIDKLVDRKLRKKNKKSITNHDNESSFYDDD